MLKPEKPDGIFWVLTLAGGNPLTPTAMQLSLHDAVTVLHVKKGVCRGL